MALLGTIRNQFGWLMMALIFIGIGSFLFMDISPGGNTPTGGSTTVGYINDEKITNDMVQVYSDEYKGAGYLNEEVREQVWDRLIGEKLLTQKATEAGIEVTPEEMGDMFLSNRPELLSPIVRQRFGDRQTGMVNTQELRQRMTEVKNTSSLMARAENDRQREEIREYQKQWFAMERNVKIDRLQGKYFQTINAGFYAPKWLAEFENKLQKASYNIDYVQIPYTNITGDVQVSDEDLKAYIAERAKEYDRKAAVSIEYLSFLVTPSAADSALYRDELIEAAEALTKSTNMKGDSNAVQRYYGEFPKAYYTEDELPLPLTLKDSFLNAPQNTVFGPYVEGQRFEVIKKVAVKTLPDSVRSRHILVRAQNPQEGQQAKVLLDSLKELLENDPSVSFDSLAAKHSQDGSRFQGGDLGWKAKDGSFVAPFEEYLFYDGKEGEYKIIYTQFGLHLIEITDTKYETNRKGYRLARVTRDIIPSPETTNDKEREVLDFITVNRTAADMTKAARELGLNVVPATGLEKGGYDIPGIGKNSSSADIIRWAHQETTELDEVANRPHPVENEELNYTERFVVPVLIKRYAAGLATLEDPEVRAEVDRAVRNQKKVELVQNAIQNASSLDAVAGQYDVTKEAAPNLVYSAARIGTIGEEPKVAALAAGTEAGKISKAVGGKEGVYVIQVQSKTDASPIQDLELARKNVTTRLSSSISSAVYEDMKKNADIVDDRPE